MGKMPALFVKKNIPENESPSAPGGIFWQFLDILTIKVHDNS
jgi:hypothetical protein